MIKTVTETDFLNSFSVSDGFSYEGLRSLFNYLEDLEESTKQPIYLDPVAIRCEYIEYDNLEEIQTDYPDITSLEDLAKHTNVIRVHGTHINDSIIIRNF